MARRYSPRRTRKVRSGLVAIAMPDAALRDLVLKRLDEATDKDAGNEWYPLVLAALEGPEELAKQVDDDKRTTPPQGMPAVSLPGAGGREAAPKWPQAQRRQGPPNRASPSSRASPSRASAASARRRRSTSRPAPASRWSSAATAPASPASPRASSCCSPARPTAGRTARWSGRAASATSTTRRRRSPRRSRSRGRRGRARSRASGRTRPRWKTGRPGRRSTASRAES